MIVVALAALASFCVPNEEFGSAYRLIKFAMLGLAAFLGIYGVMLGGMVLILHLCSLKSMGYPFLLVKGNQKNKLSSVESILRKPSDKLTKRSVYANEKQKIRLRKKGDMKDEKQ